MSPAAVRASSATPPAAPVSAMPVITTAVEPVRVASATSEQPSDAITKPTGDHRDAAEVIHRATGRQRGEPGRREEDRRAEPEQPRDPGDLHERDRVHGRRELEEARVHGERRGEQDRVALDVQSHAASVARNSDAPPWDGWRTYGAPSARSARRPTASTRRPSATRSTNGSPAAISAAVGRRFDDETPGRCGCVGTRFQSSTSSAIPSSASVRCTIVALSSAGPVPVSCRSEVNAIPETLAPL